MNEMKNCCSKTNNLPSAEAKTERPISFLVVDPPEFDKLLPELRPIIEEKTTPELRQEALRFSPTRFIVDDGKQMGYGVSAGFRGESNTYRRIYITKKGQTSDKTLIFSLSLEVPQMSESSIAKFELKLYRPFISTWSLDFDLFSKRVVKSDRDDQDRDIYVKDWDTCVFNCLRDEAPHCVYCLLEPDCWLLCAGQAVARCIWECSW